MQTNDNPIPEEEETGLSVGSMDSDYDEGDDLDTGKKTEVTADPRATWRHNAGQSYKHTSSAINEILSNAITAVLRAQRMFNVWDAGVIVRIVEKRENEVYLEVRDEGIGMTESFIEEVLARIGVTTGELGEDVNSKFGRGFFASWMLVGEEKDDGSGAFLLSTNPRVDEDNPDDTPPHNLVCQPGLFNWTDHEASLDEDEYGTRLKFPIRDGVTAEDLETWVRDYAENARMPIMLERYHPDGSVENDEIGGNDLEESYAEDSPAVVVEESGLYRAVASPSAEGKVVILDAQTSSDAPLYLPMYDWWQVDIRLLNEGGAIYDSPDEDKIGKTPIAEDNYDDVPDNKKDEYILKSEVDKYHDKQLPQPSGTRDIIDLPTEFREHIFEQLEETLENRLQTALDGLTDPDDWGSLDQEQANLLGNIIQRRHHNWNFDDLADDETIELLRTLAKSVKLINREASINDRYQISSRKRRSKRIFEVYQEYDRVFFGKSILPRRADAVWDASDDYAVIQVETEMYEDLEEIGWEKITNITTTTVDDLDVSDEIIEKFKSAQSTTSASKGGYEGVASDYNDREIKLHHTKYGAPHETTVGNIRAYFGDDIDDDYAGNLPSNIGRVVLFTSTSDHNISSHKTITDPYTATATCVNRVYEKTLAHLDNVIKFEDYDDHNTDYPLLTEDGERPLSALQAETLNPIHMSSEWKEQIQALNEDTDLNLIKRLDMDDNGLNVLLTGSDVYALRPHLTDFDGAFTSITSLTTRSLSHCPVQCAYDGRNNAWQTVVHARLPDWVENGTTEVDHLVYRLEDNSRRWEILSNVGQLHDAGETISSETDAPFGEDSKPNVVLDTSEGTLSMDEIMDSDKELVLVPITADVEDVFEDISPAVIKGFLREKIGQYRRYGDYMDYDDGDEYLVAKVDFDTAQKLARHYPVRLATTDNAPTVGNAKSSRTPVETYTPFYAYYKAKELGIEYGHLKPFVQLPLAEDGYHTVNTVADSFQ